MKAPEEYVPEFTPGVDMTMSGMQHDKTYDIVPPAALKRGRRYVFLKDEAGEIGLYKLWGGRWRKMKHKVVVNEYVTKKHEEFMSKGAQKYMDDLRNSPEYTISCDED